MKELIDFIMFTGAIGGNIFLIIFISLVIKEINKKTNEKNRKK